MKVLAVFDFDHTLTTKDSLLEFFKFQAGVPSYYWKVLQLTPYLGMYFLKFIPNWKAKQYFFRKFLAGVDEQVFEDISGSFAREIIPGILRQEAIDKLLYHKKAGHDLYIITASPQQWVRAWAEQYDIEVIGTRLECNDGKLSGYISGHNCYGAEKLKRLQERVSLEEYGRIYVYGDSGGDKEILEVATDPFYRKF